MNITLVDVQQYAQSRKPDEEVGWPQHRSACLIANTLKWKYPQITQVRVAGSNTYALVTTETNAVVEVDTQGAVEQAADKFDRLGFNYGVTRQQLERHMPELFEEEVNA